MPALRKVNQKNPKLAQALGVQRNRYCNGRNTWQKMFVVSLHREIRFQKQMRKYSNEAYALIQALKNTIGQSKCKTTRHSD